MSEHITKTIDFVKEKLSGLEAGHNWSHTERVWKLAQKIAQTESCDTEIVEIAALLHDVADPKFHNGDEQLAVDISSNFLRGIGLSGEKILAVINIIKNISFKNRGEVEVQTQPIELKIVQDADRLDAIGAIGIARTFNFGGFKNNEIYNRQIPPNLTQSKEEYKKSNGTTINHFYEKLLLLKDLMNTAKAKEMAEERHRFMLLFLEQFHKEIHEAE